MADSDAVKKLGEAARSGFKSKKDPFAGAREGAMKALGGDPMEAQGPAENLFAQPGAPAPSAMPAAPASPAPMGEDDQLQALSDEQRRLTGKPMSLDEAKAALQRRSQRLAPQTYHSIEH